MPVEINNRTKRRLDETGIKNAAELFLKKYKQTKKDVSLAFVGESVMRRLNRQYRGIDKTTDVLSFSGEGDYLGELIIDPDKIEKQAKELKRTFEEELIFILIHGLLHLVGYNDESEADRLKMIKIGERFILENLKFKNQISK